MPWPASPPDLPLRPPPVASWWSLVFAGVILGVQWTLGSGTTGHFVRPGYAAGDWWLLFSAQWVHLNAWHAGKNAVAMAVLPLAFRALVPVRWQWGALLGGHIGVAWVLALDLRCMYYAGASGALHGLLAGNIAYFLCITQGNLRMVGTGWVLLLGLVLKLLLQRASGSVEQAIYYPAHEAGALGGIVMVLLVHRFTRHQSA
ncbi:MAG: rhomboid family intramembrane serine protease [Rhodoferax sp.]|nr:rhomboid family intramembrane serine protease [Rhodoferax sp.]